MTEPEQQQPKRKRGAQPGNTNGLKHGFYSRAFRAGEAADLAALRDVQLLDEVNLLRVFLRRLAEAARDEADLETIIHSLNAAGLASSRLATILRIHHDLVGDQTSPVRLALSQALTETMKELKLK